MKRDKYKRYNQLRKEHAERQMKDVYDVSLPLYLDMIKEGTVFSMEGSHGEEFLRLKDGYISMNSLELFTIPLQREESIKCKVLGQAKLISKYQKDITWYNAWVEHVKFIANNKLKKGT